MSSYISFQGDPESIEFEKSILENRDRTTRGALADWCDEHGQPERAAVIRLGIRLEEMAKDDPTRKTVELELDVLLVVHFNCPGIDSTPELVAAVDAYVKRLRDAAAEAKRLASEAEAQYPDEEPKEVA